jgi:undecaprenyl-diphosphatase
MVELLIRLRRQDERALHLLVARRKLWMDRVMRAITRLGDAAIVIGIVAVLLASGDSTLANAGRTAALALAASHLCVQFLKRSICRARPHLPTGMESLIAAPDRFSFPSGHAAASLSVALAIIPVFAPPGGAIILGIALLVGASRCYLGVHYPGDVLAGWGLALVAHACAPLLLATS